MFYFPCSVKEAIPFLEREDVLGSEARFAALGGDAIALVSNQITKAAAEIVEQNRVKGIGLGNDVMFLSRQ